MNLRRILIAAPLFLMLGPAAGRAAPVKAAYFYSYMTQSHLDSLAAVGFNRAVIKNIGDSLDTRQLQEFQGWITRGRRLGIDVVPSWSLQAKTRLNVLPTTRRYSPAGVPVEADVGCPADSVFWKSVLYDRAEELLTAFPSLVNLLVDLEIYTGSRTHYNGGACRCANCMNEYARAIAGRDPRHIPTLDAFQEGRTQAIVTSLLGKLQVRHPGLEVSFFDLDLDWPVHRAMVRALAATGLKTMNFTERTYSKGAVAVPPARQALERLGLVAPTIAGIHLKRFSPADLPGTTKLVLDAAQGCFFFTTYSLWQDPAKLTGAYALLASSNSYWTALRTALVRAELEPSELAFDATLVSQGARLAYRFAIRNRGGVAAPPSHWTLKAGPTALASGDAAIPARDSLVVSGTLTLGLAVGEHEVRLVVDTGGQVLEDDETNNTRARGLVVMSLPPPVNMPFPSTPVLDNFNRSSGALGSRWTGTTGDAVISSSRFKPLSSGYVATVWDATFGPNQEAYVTLAKVTSSGPKQGLLLKVQGATVETGAIEVRYDGAQRNVLVATYTAGRGWEDRGGVAIQFGEGDILGARALASGHVEVYRNGVKLGRWSVGAWIHAAGGGRIGLTLNKSSSTRFDDFAGGDLAGATTTQSNRPPLAKAAANPASGLAPLAVAFSSTGTGDPDGEALTYAWSFGDGGTATTPNPSHSYGTGTFRAILTVSDGHGGGDSDTVTVTSLPQGVFPTTPVLDDFSRPNGPLAGRWVGEITGVLDSYGRFKPTTSGYLTAIWDGAVMGANQEAYVTFLEIGKGPKQGVLLKVQGKFVETGAIEVRYDAVQKKVFVATYTPGRGWEDRGAGVVAKLIDDDVLGARAYANGDVDVYRNGTKLGRWSVIGWPFAASGGRIGIALNQSADARLDTFGGGTFDLVAARSWFEPSETVDGVGSLPATVELASAMPNPFAHDATFRFGLPRASAMSLRAYDVQGRHVATLMEGHVAAGWHSVRWNGRGLREATLGAGIYLLRLDAAGIRRTRKFVIAP